MNWQLVHTKQAQKDAQKLTAAGLKDKAKALLAVIQGNPSQNPPPMKSWSGNLAGAYSRRINIQHRLVYMVLSDEQMVKVLRLWSRYD